MSGLRIVGELDPSTSWDGDHLHEDPQAPPPDEHLDHIRGAGAWVHEQDDNGWRFVRDPLGINKLFWAPDEDGAVVVAARPHLLVQTGCSFADIRAIPCGVAALIQPGREPVERSIVPAEWFGADPMAIGDVELIAATIRRSILAYLFAIAATLEPKQVFVCLSGGLDSTGVAAFAAEVFTSRVIAVSFDLEGHAGRASDDRVAAARVAKEMGLPLLEASITSDELLDHLDLVLTEGIDWRDFNVHAALVNAALAATISDHAEAGAIVMTGDLANEFLVDYEPESHGGGTYYRLPRLPPRALRAALVRGLDTCNREIGMFGAWGLRLIQPYAVGVDGYLSLPESFLRLEHRKQIIAREMFGAGVPNHVYERTKVRAQVGSASGGGVLQLCLDRGIDGSWLRDRFCALHGIEDPTELERFMRAGRYRSGFPAMAGR
jgi:asparagine synthetase B (glutamine-hydrolysing)